MPTTLAMTLAATALAFACTSVCTSALADWPTDARLSGNAFLPPGLQALQADADSNPISLWLDRGRALWMDAPAGKSCQTCHGDITTLKTAAARFPRLSADGQKVVNLEDQIITCRARTGQGASTDRSQLEDEDILALSAALHQAGKDQTLHLQPPPQQSVQSTAWQAHLSHGATLYTTRIGRMNLACVHCHDQRIGRQMRGDVISPGNPTGFPIYRMSWQGLGSIDRRLRACYSGVQATMPAPGDVDLRDLELYLKVRANGLVLDGPSIRR